METVILITICVLFVLIECAICGAVGFLIGTWHERAKNKKTPIALEFDEEKAREIERRKLEYENFLNYDGNEQKDFNG